MHRVCQQLMRSLWLVGLIIALSGPYHTAQAQSGPTLELELITSEVTNPVDIANSGVAGDGRLFVVEWAGRIRIIDAGGTLLPTPFLDIDSEVAEGMLGMAFHPDYATNGYFYVIYNHEDTNNVSTTRLARYSVDGSDANLADPGSAFLILSYEQPIFDHSGGSLHFGPDGYLYISTGDAGSGSVVQANAQATDVLLGKMLRIDVDGSSGSAADCSLTGNFTIPAGNPFLGVAGFCDEIWALGLRNPWRFSFDRSTGEMWIADVGQNEREEINLEPEAGPGGSNYGWRCYEGSLPFDTDGCNSADAYTFPVYEYNHENGRCSITGGYVYRGVAFPSLQGHYFFGDFCSNEIWSLIDSQRGLTVTTWTVQSTAPLGAIVTFGEDINGEVYLGDFHGRIFRLKPAGPLAATLSAATVRSEERTAPVTAAVFLALSLVTIWSRRRI